MFSIVIPLYNKESSIAKTLDTVFNQTFQEFEIIVVNDGSTDNSLSIVNSFADPRLKIYSKENGGVSEARNYGIQRASNDYIAFLDADDLWDIVYLEEMRKLIKKFPECGMYSCAYKCVKGNKTDIDTPNIPEGIIENYFQAILINYKISWTSATILKREAFQKVGMFPVGMISGEDSYMWCKAAVHFPVAFTNKIMATYNMGASETYYRIASPDSCKESWYDLYSDTNPFQNMFIAYKALENGMRHAWGGYRERSKKIEQQFQFVKNYSDKSLINKLKKLQLLNSLPTFAVKILLLYKKLITLYFLR